MIQFAIHTYGHYDAMFYVINGIKMIMNSDFADAMIKLMALLATSYYSILGMANAQDGRVGHYFLKTAGMLLVITVLLLPKADMLVVDRISGKKEVVSGLPYAFVLPVGVCEAFGAGITSMFEQAFSKVSSMPFKDYGMVFGQRLVQESKNWKISNPEFNRNMDSFIARCVVLEAMIGTRFTQPDLLQSPNMFDLVTKKAGTFRKIDMRINGRVVRKTCKEAGALFKQYMQNEFTILSNKYMSSDFAIAGAGIFRPQGNINNVGLNKILANNIAIGYQSTLGIEGTAEEIIRQNMMINSIKGFNNKSDLYAYTKASETQNSNWFISGELAKEYLPMLLNIMKALVYASFIFIVPLMILSGGMGKYLQYGVVVFSLQIWPALNSILNLFMELYSNLRGTGITGKELTYANFNQAHQAIDTIVLVAGGLQMSIPFLSFAIVRGGVGSFIHLANQIGGASAGAASSVAQEVVSGQRSIDNINLGGQSIDNKSGFKTDLNQLHQAGARQVQGAGGAMFRDFMDGSSSISSGAGINLSSGARSFFMEDAQQTSLQNSLTSSLSALRGAEQGFSKSRNATISSIGDLVSHIAQRESAGKSFNYDQLGEQGKSLQQAVNHYKELHNQDTYSHEQATGANVKAYAEAGLKTPESLPVKVSAGVVVEGTVTANNTSSQSLSEDERVSRGNDTSKSFNNLVKVAQNEQWMKDSSIDSSFAESIRANYDKMQSYQETVSQKQEESDTYSMALQGLQSSGATDRREMYHELEQNVMKRYGVDQSSAHKMIEQYDSRVNKVWNDMVQLENGKLMEQVKSGREYVEGVAGQNKDEFHNEYAGKVNDQNVQSLKTRADQQGLSREAVQSSITSQGNKLHNEYGNISNENAVQYNSVNHHNQVVEKSMQERVKEYEKDRIGQGSVGSNLGIGGPNAAERAKLNLQKAKGK